MRPHSIGDNVARFIQTHDVLFLANAGLLTLRQGRATELLYGAYCALLHGPSPVTGEVGGDLLAAIDGFRRSGSHDVTLSRDELIRKFAADFDVRSLPEDFVAARCEGIVTHDNLLIIGEYSLQSARVAIVTRDSCVVNDYYNRLPGVCHIHLIHSHGPPGELVVATGDTRKLLDLWAVDGANLRFIGRIRKRLAGHSAACTVKGALYLGTDFSCRPNYIETLRGKKYFFPRQAYTKYTVAFLPVLDRYIFSINTDLQAFGGRRVLSVFDTATERFVYCEDLALSDASPGVESRPRNTNAPIHAQRPDPGNRSSTRESRAAT
jgi:hypothetical protein